jgi:uncharacterized protein YebE (UPF0316 family)
MKIETKYNLGDIVFLITDKDQYERIITGIIIRPFGVTYYLSCGTEETNHYEMEFNTSKNYK